MKRTTEAPIMVRKGKSQSVQPCLETMLLPGSYPAVAGATIAAGASGVVAYDGKVITATNHSKCGVSLGDPVGLHISPTCGAYFVPCVCCDSPADPNPTCESTYPCCRTPFAYCLLAPFGASLTRSHIGFASLKDTVISIPGPYDSPFTLICPDGSQVFLRMTMTCCNDGVPDVAWEARNLANEVIASGSFSVSGLCATPATVERHVLTLPDGCSMVVSFASEYSEELCGGGGPPSSPCCDQLLWFCLNNQSVQLAVEGGTHIFDVSACCNTTASLEISLQCNPSPSPGSITLQWLYTAGSVIASGAENMLMSQFCVDGAPRIITFGGSPCFLQLLVSIVQFDCTECLFGDSPETTDPPPP